MTYLLGLLAAWLPTVVWAQATPAYEPPSFPQRSQTVPLLSGQWSVENEWVLDSDTGEDALASRIRFTLDSRATLWGGYAKCPTLRLIQIARLTKADGTPVQWDSGETPRNEMRSGAGYFVDHQASRCQPNAPCSPFFRDYWENPSSSSEGPRDASLFDAPYGWTQFETGEFETCAVCPGVADPKKLGEIGSPPIEFAALGVRAIYGCVKWGGKFPTHGRKTILPAQASSEPSSDFLEAATFFFEYYRKQK